MSTLSTWARAVILLAALATASGSLARDIPIRAGSPSVDGHHMEGSTGGAAPLRHSVRRSASPAEISPPRSASPPTVTLEGYPSPAYAKHQNWRFDLKSVVTFQHSELRAARTHCPSCERSASVDMDGIGEVHMRRNEHTVSV